jgi:hypothetical protein
MLPIVGTRQTVSPAACQAIVAAVISALLCRIFTNMPCLRLVLFRPEKMILGWKAAINYRGAIASRCGTNIILKIGKFPDEFWGKGVI